MTRTINGIAMLFALVGIACSLPSLTNAQDEHVSITDALGRKISIPQQVEHVICSGAGCLRYLTYLQAQDRIVAVDDVETRNADTNIRPYALANPQFQDYPIFGEFRGHDNPELIVSLEPQPQVIFKTYSTMGHDPEELQQKTGIPVIVLEYGNLTTAREQMYQALRLMGDVMGKQERAKAVLAFFDQTIEDLAQRTADVPDDTKPTCYVGGISFKGPHGFQSTEPTYPPFWFTHSRNVAYDPNQGADGLNQVDVAKEQIIAWDPEIVFLDLATMRAETEASALYELQHDPAYQSLQAVQAGQVYGVLAYNSYTQNHGSILANAYFVGKLLYPDRFADIDPRAKADEMYEFLVGQPVFDRINTVFNGQAFTKLQF